MSTTFNSITLVSAVQQLFELNNYQVEGPIKINGAEIDLVVTPLGDPFGRRIYIEVTVEYVDNEKYGKDLTKLAMMATLDPQSQKIIISSSGFSLPVKERSRDTNILTLTYDELFQRFEKFDPYISRHTGDTDEAKFLKSLASVYEEPNFEDSWGREVATQYLTDWKNRSDAENRWIVITGEYGTGKTALTQILHYRWLNDYKKSPLLPIPFRIELRNFSRQFDAKGLLHHFLDSNGLSHVSIDFAEKLVRTGRIILLLDGYDEMAQYFNSRERRQCLEALASLSAEGAKGLLTSRPNYFTQSEELQVFEVLYTSLKPTSMFSSSGTARYLENEEKIDRLLARFLDQFERNLKDLSQEQTRDLVARILRDDAAGLEVVLALLSKVFRESEGEAKALSGKPVIVAYLLEVVEQLKAAGDVTLDHATLTEWQIYEMIVDQLMLRDFSRSPEVMPDQRRQFLRRLAVFLSNRNHDSIGEEEFRDLVSSQFKREINRSIGEAKVEAASRYFSDLRSSTTLTRSISHAVEGWRFSHNSLREYLVAEEAVQALLKELPISERMLVTDAMKTFTKSIGKETQQKLFSSLCNVWKESSVPGWGKGQLLELLWEGFLSKLENDAPDPVKSLLRKLTSDQDMFYGVDLRRLSFSSNEKPSDLTGMVFKSTSLSDLKFNYANLCNTDFANSILDNVSFEFAKLTNAKFEFATLFDVDFSHAIIAGASFRNVDVEAMCIIGHDATGGLPIRMTGKVAIGYLNYHGAITDDIPYFYVVQHHPNFPIALKIIENLSKQTLHQRRGLVS